MNNKKGLNVKAPHNFETLKLYNLFQVNVFHNVIFVS